MHLDELLVFRRLHSLAPLVFHLCDDVAHAAAHKAQVKRLRHEIRRAHLESARLPVMVALRRHGDDGQLDERVVAAQIGEHLEAVHDGHDEVEQYDAHISRAEFFERLLPVRRLDDLEAV